MHPVVSGTKDSIRRNAHSGIGRTTYGDGLALGRMIRSSEGRTRLMGNPDMSLRSERDAGHALIADQLLQQLHGLRGQGVVQGVCLVRNSVTRRIDWARCVGPRQSFCTSRLGATRAISALISAGCGVSEPGWSKSGVRYFLTNSEATENTKSPPNMLRPKLWMTSSVSVGSRASMVLAKPLTASSQVARFSCRPIGFCSTAAVMRSGAISHRVRQKLAPMQPPMTWKRRWPRW